MQTRRIGSLEVSLVGIGCNNFGWRIDEEATRSVVAAALESGVTLFDTADIYGGTESETFLGRILGDRRDDVVLATKFGMRIDDERKGAAPDYVRSACDDSLRRLATDRIDLYQLHQPDESVPIADTLGALDDLVREGKVREIGCSNFTVDQLREAESAARGGARFVSVQNEYSLLHRAPEDGVLAECERLDVGFIPYFPLASGLLSGKYRKGHPTPPGSRIDGTGRFSNLLSDRNLTLVEQLTELAEAHGRTLLELAFSWLAAQPAVVSVIAGATRPEQIRANAAAADWRLTAEELAEVRAILEG